jgi:capsular polysaccharide transport system permease protein
VPRFVGHANPTPEHSLELVDHRFAGLREQSPGELPINRMTHIFDEMSPLPAPTDQSPVDEGEAESRSDTDQPAHRLAWRRTRAVSAELRKSAQAARGSTANSASGNPKSSLSSGESMLARARVLLWPRMLAWPRIPTVDYRRFSTLGRRQPRLVVLIAGCLVPAALVAFYLGFVMSAQYTAYAQFAVISGASASSDPISKLTGLSGFQQTQDAMIVINYLQSPALVAELEQKAELGKRFSRSDVDWLSRFHGTESFDKLAKYWRKQIKVNAESVSGIITIKVSAFSPEDALAIAKAVVAASERTINAMSLRAVRDATAEAEDELKRAEQRLQEIRIALLNLRNAQSTLDPHRTADGLAKLAAELRLERAHLEDDASAAKRSNIEETAPQMQLLRVKIEVISNQISDLDRLVTATAEAKSAATISDKMTSFDRLETDHNIAEKRYTTALQTFERARLNAESKKVYLGTFAPPLLPHDVSWPSHRLLTALLGAAAVMALYWVVTRVIARVFGYQM